ncbi:unnamed protein product, partial [Protopolystoma xenopodis]
MPPRTPGCIGASGVRVCKTDWRNSSHSSSSASSSASSAPLDPTGYCGNNGYNQTHELEPCRSRPKARPFSNSSPLPSGRFCSSNRSECPERVAPDNEEFLVKRELSTGLGEIETCYASIKINQPVPILNHYYHQYNQIECPQQLRQFLPHQDQVISSTSPLSHINDSKFALPMMPNWQTNLGFSVPQPFNLPAPVRTQALFNEPASGPHQRSASARWPSRRCGLSEGPA